MIVKNRDRDKYTFANINLLGSCNADCYFCLGKDIENELYGKNQLHTPHFLWKNFQEFLDRCRQEGVTKLYITGQTADGLQHIYLSHLVDYLQESGFSVGVRTNGYLALKKLSIIRKMKDEIGYSIHSLDPDTNYKIMKRRGIPNWDYLLRNSGDNVRISIVLNRYNYHEFYALLDFISNYPVRYVQVRRISTDTRYELLKEDIEIYEQVYKEFANKFQKKGDFYLAQQYDYKGMEVDFWRTVETSVNSLNYFTDGTISDEYFIVEGYMKNK